MKGSGCGVKGLGVRVWGMGFGSWSSRVPVEGEGV